VLPDATPAQHENRAPGKEAKHGQRNPGHEVHSLTWRQLARRLLASYIGPDPGPRARSPKRTDMPATTGRSPENDSRYPCHRDQGGEEKRRRWDCVLGGVKFSPDQSGISASTSFAKSVRDSCQPRQQASAGMTSGTPSWTMFNSVPQETFF